MADRYISREWLLKELNECKNLKTWNTEVCDPDTIMRVLQVVENLVNGAPNIGPMQYGNKELKVKNAALKLHLDLLKEQLRCDERDRDLAEFLAGTGDAKFSAGRCEATKEEIGWLERMVRDD